MANMNEVDRTTFNRLGLLLIIIGAVFAVDTFWEFGVAHKLWPILTVILGAGLVGVFVKRRGQGIVYLAVGEYLICFSAVALYCNFTSWTELARIWPVFIIFLGVVLLTLFFIRRRKSRRVVLFLGLLLTALAIFFFLIFSLGANWWWVIFIFVGLCFLLAGRKS